MIASNLLMAIELFSLLVDDALGRMQYKCRRSGRECLFACFFIKSMRSGFVFLYGISVRNLNLTVFDNNKMKPKQFEFSH
jgi:hypothetical protein